MPFRLPGRTSPLLALFLTLLCAPVAAETRSELTLEAILGSPDLSGPRLRAPRLDPTGSRVTFLRGRPEDRDLLDLWEYHRGLGVTRRLIAADDVLPGPVDLSPEERARRERERIADLRGIVDYLWGPDGRRILFPLGGDLYLADVSEEPVTVRPLTAGEDFDRDPKLSPDGRRVAFVRDQDLWVVDVESGETEALTRDGEGTVSNGVAEFIAQEEMGRSTGYWWSPDSRRIAFLQVDTAPVPATRRYEIDAEEIRIVEQRYPFAGGPNVKIRLGVIEVESGEIRWVDLGGDDVYVPRVEWTSDPDALSFQVQSRDQRRLELVLQRLGDGCAPDCRRVLVTETSETWINLHDDLHFLDGEAAFVWSSERSGHRHLYLFGLDGKLIRPLTAGDWSVGQLSAVDEALGLVYFEGGPAGPVRRHVYRQSLATETPEAVQRVSRREGWHEAGFDAEGRVYLDLFSSTEQPPQLSLHSADGERLAWLVENRIDDDHPYAPFADGHRPTEFGTLAAEDGQALHWKMIRPAEFDAEHRYPVFLHVYGGPTSRMVADRWGRRFLIDQFMARQGYVVFSLDNRGIAGQGVAFQAPAWQNLGRVEVVDQMRGREFLSSRPFVDPDRIGVFGWSYGGYMALMMLMQHPGAFAAGVAVAPVTDWRLYDTHYTERYLGMPTDESGEPAPAYVAADVLEVADDLADPLLLVHGMADDNVLFTHSTALMQQLQEAAIDFDLMTYPGEKHAVAGRSQRLHLYRHVKRFLDRHLTPGKVGDQGPGDGD